VFRFSHLEGDPRQAKRLRRGNRKVAVYSPECSQARVVTGEDAGDSAWSKHDD
jgi:hypothetical protein